MDKNQINNQIKKLSKLKQYKDLPAEKLEQIAIEKLSKIQKKKDDEVVWFGLNDEECILADEYYNNFINNHSIEGFNDKENLKTLVFNLILEKRLKEKIHSIAIKEEFPPKHFIDSLSEIQTQNLNLKKQLGLEDKKQEGWIDFWKRLTKKLNIYAQTHSGAFYFKCPTCGEMALLCKKVEDYNIFNFKVFRGTFVYSEELCKMIDEKIISVERAASVLGVSPEYMQGCYEKLFLQEKNSAGK